ncbi:MAG: hypothetical protein C4539_16955 [Ignavibacteriales bacterium]|nr:MAG: hypothetical protein C4539_16955 [Ignavibacteriales bacterium]
MFILTSISFSQEEFEAREGDTTFIMKKYYFCLLKRGPNRNIDSVKLAEIQKGHLAHLNKLADDGKISIAGPFDGDFDWRGIIIFNTKTKEEAEQLQSEDPAVKAGRLIFEIYPWWAAKGSKLN